MKNYNYLPPKKASRVRKVVQEAEKYKNDNEIQRLIYKLNSDPNLTIDRWIEKIKLRMVVIRSAEYFKRKYNKNN